MHYSDRPGHVRADFFTASGKWKYTEVLDMGELYWSTCGSDAPGDPRFCRSGPHPRGLLIHDAVIEARRQLGRHHDLICVVLEPYHEYSFPIMLQPLKA